MEREIKERKQTVIVLECEDCDWKTTVTLVDFFPYAHGSDKFLEPAEDICKLHEEKTGHTTYIGIQK